MSLGALESYGCVDSFSDISSVPGAPVGGVIFDNVKKLRFWGGFFPKVRLYGQPDVRGKLLEKS